MSGALTGLTRVRRFQQDDAHIFCRQDQVVEEIMVSFEMFFTLLIPFKLSFFFGFQFSQIIKFSLTCADRHLLQGCISFLEYAYIDVFGFTFKLNLSTRPEVGYLGDIETW